MCWVFVFFRRRFEADGYLYIQRRTHIQNNGGGGRWNRCSVSCDGMRYGVLAFVIISQRIANPEEGAVGDCLE